MSKVPEADAQVMVPLRAKPLKQLNRIAKRPPLDIEFQDLVYSVRDSNSKGGWRTLLKTISGKFRSGEVTTIMGPSGAGKSTLLNILAGYVTAGVKGSIKVNDRPREMKIFNKLSSYIMQEDIVQPRLSVREAMIFSASVKLDSHITQREKEAVVDEVITLLGLEQCAGTMSEYLSGGQRKRLSIAVELVNNPPVIFLDEPTTGLDNFSIKQCMDLLQKISKLGMTVICTIHQPPASLFQTFDQVYILADGYCVYNGSPSQLVPFMSNAGCPCPKFNTPADYIMEIVHLNPAAIKPLSEVSQNGKLNFTSQEDACAKLKSRDTFCDIYEETTQSGIQQSDIEFATTFWTQFWLVLNRMVLQMSRNRTMLYIQFFHHLMAGFLIGGIFYGIGNNASQTLSVFKYLVSCNVFYVYTYVMSPVLLFPLEVKLLKREHFNRWYSLKAYYLALSVSTLPLLLVLGTMFSAIVYFMTHQPMEIDRFLGFTLMGITVALCSQGLGYAIGSIFNITKGSVVGPSIMAPLLAFSVYGMGYRDAIQPIMRVAMSISYIRYGIVGFTNTLFKDRAPLECTDEIYCHYSRPEILMKDVGVPIVDYRIQVAFILGITAFYRITGYLFLKYKLNSELSNKIVHYANKIVNHKNKSREA